MFDPSEIAKLVESPAEPPIFEEPDRNPDDETKPPQQDSNIPLEGSMAEGVTNRQVRRPDKENLDKRRVGYIVGVVCAAFVVAAVFGGLIVWRNKSQREIASSVRSSQAIG